MLVAPRPHRFGGGRSGGFSTESLKGPLPSSSSDGPSTSSLLFCVSRVAERSAVEERCRHGKDAWGGKRRGRDVGKGRVGENERVLLPPRIDMEERGVRGVADGDKTRGGRSGEDSGGTVAERWVTDGDKIRGSKGGEDGKDEVRGGEVAEPDTRGAVAGETRRGDSAGGNAGVATDAMEEHTKTEGSTTAVVATDAMEEHTKTKGDTAAVVATDAMEEHTETKGNTAAAGRVALAESIVEATKADGEKAANRKGVARVTNDMEGVITTDEDAGAAFAGNEEEAVIGVTGAGNEEGAVTGVVRGQCVDTRESG
ncbi:hypothetical protein CBR_g20139 [Chara braunii]|uniref:Uncharacterized protein n=1 Tax=Chara braunii TaxID=69332 RepID=A0A388KZR6_CHABU|nr:hypothetical protein CBR_g20139 [Chara braunii]|eukprot:GBG75508.1 hypothetical protein CBR_g20139 [Chara braunii]